MILRVRIYWPRPSPTLHPTAGAAAEMNAIGTQNPSRTARVPKYHFNLYMEVDIEYTRTNTDGTMAKLEPRHHLLRRLHG